MPQARITDREQEAFEQAIARLQQDNPELAAAAVRMGKEAARKRFLSYTAAIIFAITLLFAVAIIGAVAVRVFRLIAGV